MKKSAKKITYNPCESCIHREYWHCCPFKRRTVCSRFVFSKYLNMIEDGDPQVPDEILIEILRKKGWHGEIRQQTSIQI